MREVETHIDIAAPTQRVWDVLTDFAAYPEWNPFFIAVDGRAHPGEKLALHTKFSRRFSPRVSTVTVRTVDPPCRLRWGGGLAIPRLADGEHGFHLDATDGGTRMRHYGRFSGLLIPMAGMLISALEQRCHELNSALRTRVEG
ncbi:SRPBCC domain-containing protein [Nocardia sp. NBC_00881]|uniref:SRPBCC family protein n=1 Tax=Nocardia sp. NBC_00881 TaxID=2975995 RepID=UPI00386F72D3|nr:SRPBCC domain-containing protein [Nocardia sp. NBC_00881]